MKKTIINIYIHNFETNIMINNNFKFFEKNSEFYKIKKYYNISKLMSVIELILIMLKYFLCCFFCNDMFMFE